jgi:hypothetical protein
MKQRFSIVLEGSDDTQPVVIRLRQALKLLGRAFRLKCVEIRESDVSVEILTTDAGNESKNNQHMTETLFGTTAIVACGDRGGCSESPVEIARSRHGAECGGRIDTASHLTHLHFQGAPL